VPALLRLAGFVLQNKPILITNFLSVRTSVQQGENTTTYMPDPEQQNGMSFLCLALANGLQTWKLSQPPQ
jgi:hypothetical protein